MVFLVIFYSLQGCYFNIVCLANGEGSFTKSYGPNTKLLIPQTAMVPLSLALLARFELRTWNLLFKHVRWLGFCFVTSLLQSNENIISNSKEWKIKHFKEGWIGWMWCYVSPEVKNYCRSVLTKGFKIKSMVTVWFLFLLHHLLFFRLCKSWVTKKLHK